MTDRKEDEVPIFSGDDSEWLDASYQIPARDFQAIQNKILTVVRQKALAAKRMPSIKIPKGTKKYTVETRHHVLHLDRYLK